MSLIIISLNQISIMAIFILVGVLCYKTKMVDHYQNQALSAITINIITPMLIFQSYQTNLDAELAHNLLGAFILAILSYILSMGVAPLFVKRKNNPNHSIESVSVIYSNCGFIGIPLVQAVLGDGAVVFLTAYITISAIFTWTHGYLTVSEQKLNKKSLVKALTTPSLIAVYAGATCLVFGIQVPDMLNHVITPLSNMNMPMSLFIAGITIAQTDLNAALKNIRIYYITFLKLLVMPMFTVLLCIPFARLGFDHTMLATICMAVACPAGATCTMLAVQYEKNEKYASELFAMTTILSAFSIPVIVFMTGIF